MRLHFTFCWSFSWHFRELGDTGKTCKVSKGDLLHPKSYLCQSGEAEDVFVYKINIDLGWWEAVPEQSRACCDANSPRQSHFPSPVRAAKSFPSLLFCSAKPYLNILFLGQQTNCTAVELSLFQTCFQTAGLHFRLIKQMIHKEENSPFHLLAETNGEVEMQRCAGIWLL